MRTNNNGKWRSSGSFILAGAGAAIGLGNIWKFPYIAFDNGGGGFVLVYLLCIALIGLPLLISEVLLGKLSESGVVEAFRKLNFPSWRFVGYFGILTSIGILAFYSIVGGWSLSMCWESLRPMLGLGEAIEFTKHISDPFWQIKGYLLFLIITAFMVMKGLTGGTSRILNGMMILLVVLLIILTIISLNQQEGSFSRIVEFLFAPDFSAFSWKMMTEAIGHAFFTLSIGLGAMLTYGAYLKEESSVLSSSLWIALVDTLISICACFMIFPIIFKLEDQGEAITQSASMLFIAVEQLLRTYSYGNLLSLLFFLLLSLAAISSAISMFEIVIAALVERFGADARQKIRKKAVGVFTGFIAVICLLSALSFNGDKALFDKPIFSEFKTPFSRIKQKRVAVSEDKLLTVFNIASLNELERSLASGDIQQQYFQVNKIETAEQSSYAFLPDKKTGKLIVKKTWEERLKGFFDFFDYLTSNWMLPVGGLLIILFTGWVLPPDRIRAELGDSRKVKLLIFLIRYIVPAAILTILVFSA